MNPCSRSCVELAWLVDMDVPFLPAHEGLRAASGFSAVHLIVLVPAMDRRYFCGGSMVGFLVQYIRGLTKKKKKKKKKKKELHLRVDKSGPGLRRRQGSSHYGAFVRMMTVSPQLPGWFRGVEPNQCLLSGKHQDHIPLSFTPGGWGRGDRFLSSDLSPDVSVASSDISPVQFSIRLWRRAPSRSKSPSLSACHHSAPSFLILDSG